MKAGSDNDQDKEIQKDRQRQTNTIRYGISTISKYNKFMRVPEVHEGQLARQSKSLVETTSSQRCSVNHYLWLANIHQSFKSNFWKKLGFCPN